MPIRGRVNPPLLHPPVLPVVLYSTQQLLLVPVVPVLYIATLNIAAVASNSTVPTVLPVVLVKCGSYKTRNVRNSS